MERCGVTLLKGFLVIQRGEVESLAKAFRTSTTFLDTIDIFVIIPLAGQLQYTHNIITGKVAKMQKSSN